MKLTHILAAGLMIAGIGVSAEASAQYRGGYSQDHRGDRDGRYNNHNDRRDYRGGYRNNGNRYGWRNNRHRDCRVVYRHHRRVRICR